MLVVDTWPQPVSQTDVLLKLASSQGSNPLSMAMATTFIVIIALIVVKPPMASDLRSAVVIGAISGIIVLVASLVMS